MLNISEQLGTAMLSSLEGSVSQTVGMTVAVMDFPAPIGALVEIKRSAGEPVMAEVIGFKDEQTIIFPFSGIAGVRRGSRVILKKTRRTIALGNGLLGRVIDAHGNALDGLPQPVLTDRSALDRTPPPAVQRPRIDEIFSTGIRVLDGLMTCGKGQRLGIFAGSGVGKSVTLGMMSRFSSSDVNVIALIGERGREVNEFIERDLGPDGLARSVVVVATSDEPALRRVQAAYTATTVAEYFRDQNSDVLLLMDSATRFAMAQREIGLAAGEPPTTRGYPPSVFALLPQLVERSGRSPLGSITAFYSVLVEGDDQNEPIADTLRGLLDGHVWLSRKVASRGHYPAVDVLESLSRLMNDLADPQHLKASVRLRELLSAYADHEDLISIGAYQKGANPTVDTAVAMLDDINAFLRQGIHETSLIGDTRNAMLKLLEKSLIPPPKPAMAMNTPQNAQVRN